MDFKEIISNPGRRITFYPQLGIYLGDTDAGLILSQFIFWTGKSKLQNGWIYKQSKEIFCETTVPYRRQAKARKKLKELRLIEEKRRPRAGWIEFRVNIPRLQQFWAEAEAREKDKNEKSGPLPDAS